MGEVKSGKLLLGAFGASETHLAEKPFDKRYCRHTNFSFEVSERARSIRCTGCDAILEPFGVLLSYANGERKWKHWDGESRKAGQSLQAAKDEEKLVKARTRAASRKDAQTAVDSERKRVRERVGQLHFRVSDLRDLADQLDRFLDLSLPVPAREEVEGTK